VGAFPVWRPNLDELDVVSAPASAFLILKSLKIIPLQLGCRLPARVLACLLSDGPVVQKLRMSHETHQFRASRQGAPTFSSSFDRDNDSFRRNRHYSPPSSKPEHR
jgi:hypothetical protein